jgi:hypothetical protein
VGWCLEERRYKREDRREKMIEGRRWKGEDGREKMEERREKIEER